MKIFLDFNALLKPDKIKGKEQIYTKKVTEKFSEKHKIKNYFTYIITKINFWKIDCY